MTFISSFLKSSVVLCLLSALGHSYSSWSVASTSSDLEDLCAASSAPAKVSYDFPEQPHSVPEPVSQLLVPEMRESDRVAIVDTALKIASGEMENRAKAILENKDTFFNLCYKLPFAEFMGRPTAPYYPVMMRVYFDTTQQSEITVKLLQLPPAEIQRKAQIVANNAQYLFPRELAGSCTLQTTLKGEGCKGILLSVLELPADEVSLRAKRIYPLRLWVELYADWGVFASELLKGGLEQIEVIYQQSSLLFQGFPFSNNATRALIKAALRLQPSEIEAKLQALSIYNNWIFNKNMDPDIINEIIAYCLGLPESEIQGRAVSTIQFLQAAELMGLKQPVSEFITLIKRELMSLPASVIRTLTLDDTLDESKTYPELYDTICRCSDEWQQKQQREQETERLKRLSCNN